MKNSILTIICLSLLLGFSHRAKSQETSKKNTLFKKRIIRALDLREKQNKPLFSQNNELSRVILNAVLEGKLTAYRNDSLSSILSPEDVSTRLIIKEAQEWSDTLFMLDDFEKDLFKINNVSYSYLPRDLYQVELSQDWIIDNQKSVLKKENRSISFFVPADHPENEKGFQQELFTVSYEECSKFWKSSPDAIWFNPYNDNEHLSLTHAFKLELYSSYIVKVSNPDNEFIADYSPEEKSIIEAKKAAYKLMEYESNLWEN